MKRLGEAERLFEEAVRREPSLAHLGTYASFLFEHGRDPHKALSMLLQTLQLEAFNGDGSTGSTEPLFALARQMGIPENSISARINEAIEAGRVGLPPEIVRNWRNSLPNSAA